MTNKKPAREPKAAGQRRRQTGVRLPAETLKLVRIYAAEHDLREWEAQDLLLRAGLEVTKSKE